jgi:hypothetical protein
MVAAGGRCIPWFDLTCNDLLPKTKIGIANWGKESVGIGE